MRLGYPILKGRHQQMIHGSVHLDTPQQQSASRHRVFSFCLLHLRPAPRAYRWLGAGIGREQHLSGALPSSLYHLAPRVVCFASGYVPFVCVCVFLCCSMFVVCVRVLCLRRVTCWEGRGFFDVPSASEPLSWLEPSCRWARPITHRKYK